MNITPYNKYLVTNRIKERSSIYESFVGVTGLEIKEYITELTINISIMHTYEIYTKNPETGEGGWDIKLVRSIDELIKKYPNFDCIITKNDSPENQCVDFLNFNV